MLKLLSIMALLPCLILAQSNCQSAKFSGSNDCAIIYDGDGCANPSQPISVGYRALGQRKHEPESVTVKKGCTFTLYEFASDDKNKRGRSVVIDAKGKTQDFSRDFESVEELSGATDCSC